MNERPCLLLVCTFGALALAIPARSAERLLVSDDFSGDARTRLG